MFDDSLYFAVLTMKFKTDGELLIHLVIIIDSIGLSKQGGHQENTSICRFDIEAGGDAKHTFEDFTKMENAWLIYFDITLIPDPFIANTIFDGKQINGLTRWIWVSRKHSNLLSYPVDLDVITFQLSKNVEKKMAVVANASFLFDSINLDTYSICIESLYGTILENILNRNKTDWMFCNRYFEGQSYKFLLYELTGAWLGFDFACFDSVHDTVTSVTYIKKGTVNIVINIFFIVLCLYLPLLFLFLPNRYNVEQENVKFYRKGEYPNSFSRLILRLNDTPKHKKKHINR